MRILKDVKLNAYVKRAGGETLEVLVSENEIRRWLKYHDKKEMEMQR